MLNRFASLLANLAALVLPGASRAADPQVQSLGQDFLDNLPPGWTCVQGIMRTPPKMRHFSFTQFLVSRGLPPS
jgi:hypothetical protein